MRVAPKIVRADCDLGQVFNECMPPGVWRCGCGRENRETSFLYTVLAVDARRGSGSDRIAAKTTERFRIISTFLYAKK